MTTTSKPAAPPSGFRHLAESCHRHLQWELSELENLRASLTALRDRLSRGESGNSPEVPGSLAEIPQAMTRLREARNKLRAELATALGVRLPETTIRRLIAALDPADREPLEAQRSRTEQAARDVEIMTQQVAALARSGMQVFQRLLEALTGGGQAGRYSRQGIEERAACGGLLHTRC